MQKSNDNNFWKRESDANFSRRKNMDLVEYVSIPFESFPLGKYNDEAILSCEERLLSLKDKRMLNLTGKTSTDLKEEYGVANLPVINEYDENYIQMIKLLDEYGSLLFDAGHRDDAVTVLESAISAGSDIKHTYTLLASIYADTGRIDNIKVLIDKAGILDSLMKNPIINALTEYITSADS